MRTLFLILFSSLSFAQGIWTNDISEKNLTFLYNEGFRKIHFNLGHFYNEEKQIIEFDTLHNRYLFAVKLGYKQFLIGADWGLFEEISSWKTVIELFNNKEDVVFYSGEPYLGLAKCCSMNDSEIDSLIRLRNSYSDKYYFDEVFRNYEKLTNVVDSSKCAFSEYPFQEQYWHSKVPFIWIYGNSNWHTWLNFLTKTIDYEYLKEKADELEIKDFWLYQGDTDNFFRDVEKFFGIDSQTERRKEFIKTFGEK